MLPLGSFINIAQLRLGEVTLQPRAILQGTQAL